MSHHGPELGRLDHARQRDSRPLTRVTTPITLAPPFDWENAMALDPICGMTVNEATARSAEREGETFYFCGEGCRQKFLQQAQPTAVMVALPLALAAPANVTPAAAAVAAPAKYFCPMCAGVESNRPGDCPKCGMALERNPA